MATTLQGVLNLHIWNGLRIGILQKNLCLCCIQLHQDVNMEQLKMLTQKSLMLKGVIVGT
jgi:hypothetical protein